MRIPAFPIVAAVALLAAPAFAQNTNMTGNQPYGSTGSTGVQSWQHPAGITSDTQQKIRQSLENSGFRNVQVMPEAFVIRAQAPDGSHVVMLMRPDELMGFVQQSGTSTAPGSTQSGMGSSSQPYSSTPGGNWSSGQGNMTR